VKDIETKEDIALLIHEFYGKVKMDEKLNPFFTDLDFESYLPSSIFVIEWGAPFVTSLTDQYLDIKISQGLTETSRQVEITPIGQRWSGFKV
jgi:tRNA A37 threonylcarbamoyladenosine biosynthesis protein TsaE